MNLILNSSVCVHSRGNAKSYFVSSGWRLPADSFIRAAYCSDFQSAQFSRADTDPGRRARNLLLLLLAVDLIRNLVKYAGHPSEAVWTRASSDSPPWREHIVHVESENDKWSWKLWGSRTPLSRPRVLISAPRSIITTLVCVFQLLQEGSCLEGGGWKSLFLPLE